MLYTKLPPTVGTPPSFPPRITRNALIRGISQIRPDVARRHGRRNKFPRTIAVFHRERRLAVAIRVLMLHAQVHRIPGADLQVGDTLRLPDTSRSTQGGSGRVALGGASGIGTKLAIQEQQLGGGDAQVEERFEGFGVVVQHVLLGFKAVGDAVRAIVPPATTHTPLVVTIATTRLVSIRAAVQLEFVDVGVQSAGDDHLVILERLRDNIGVQSQRDVLGDRVEVLNLSREVSLFDKVEEQGEVAHHLNDGVLNVGLQL